MKNRGITKKDTEIHKNRNQGRSLPVILTYSGPPPPTFRGTSYTTCNAHFVNGKYYGCL